MSSLREYFFHYVKKRPIKASMFPTEIFYEIYKYLDLYDLIKATSLVSKSSLSATDYILEKLLIGDVHVRFLPDGTRMPVVFLPSDSINKSHKLHDYAFLCSENDVVYNIDFHESCEKNIFYRTGPSTVYIFEESRENESIILCDKNAVTDSSMLPATTSGLYVDENLGCVTWKDNVYFYESCTFDIADDGNINVKIDNKHYRRAHMSWISSWDTQEDMTTYRVSDGAVKKYDSASYNSKIFGEIIHENTLVLFTGPSVSKKINQPLKHFTMNRLVGRQYLVDNRIGRTNRTNGTIRYLADNFMSNTLTQFTSFCLDY